jgi:hypothetical protein
MKENGPDEGVERPRDIALILLKSGLNMLPFGGSLASLLEFIPTTHQKNVEKAIGLFCQRLTDLEDRMDAKAVDKQEFAELFQTCARTMERTHREDKLRAAANILANLLLKPGDRAKVSYEELDHLIRCVDALSTGALSVLGAIRNITERHPLGPNVDAIQFQHLRAAFPKMSAAFLRSLVSELQGFHLATAQELGIRGSGEEEYDGSHVRLTPIGQDAHRTIHRKPHVSPLPGRPHLQNRVVVFFPSPAPHIMTFFSTPSRKKSQGLFRTFG